MHEQIKDHLHSEGLEKATQLAEAKHAIVLLQKETAKYEKETEELTKENFDEQEVVGKLSRGSKRRHDEHRKTDERFSGSE